MLNLNLMRGAMMLQVAANKFSWAANQKEIIIAALLSMVPMFEGRYAVTVMVGMGMPVGFAYLLAALCSTIPVPFILLLLRPVLDWFYTLPIKPVRKFAEWLEARSERKRAKMMDDSQGGLRGKLKGRISAEAIELLGLYIFVALPLPGTGAWTGSAIATLFKMPRLKAGLVIMLGNFTVCAITTAATMGIISIF